MWRTSRRTGRKQKVTRAGADAGFTLIELLVVVLIIGVLAAIAIPAFLGQRNSASDSVAQTDVANLKLSVAVYVLDDPDETVPSLGDLTGFSASGGVTNHAVNDTSPGFCVTATSASGTVFSATANGAVQKGSC